MGVSDITLLLTAARETPNDVAITLRLAAHIVDCGDAEAFAFDPGAVFRRLAALDPAGLGWAAWGRWLSNRGEAAALTLLRRAVVALPARAQSWCDYANTLHRLKSPLAAAAAARALALAPADADYVFNAGCDRHDADCLDEAERLLRRARRMAPGQPEIWARAAGLALQRRNAHLATERAKRAFALEPAAAAAANVLGMTLVRTQKREAAARWFLRALRATPDFPEAQLNLSLYYLESGRLGPGWRFYESRFASRGYREGVFRASRWRGQSLAGKRLLVWREQGVGDEILFSSCLADVASAAAEVVVLCDRRLVSLFSRSFPKIRFVAEGAEPEPACDYHVPIGGLPGFVRRSFSSFASAPSAWLRAEAAAVAAWRRRLSELPAGPRIGLAWKSGLVVSDRLAAYTALADWSPLLKMPGINVINLQYGACEDEILEIERNHGVVLWRWKDLDLKNDFENTAALITNLDLVICPATAAGELAGALGVCVWRLGTPDWTFLGSRARPWFATQRQISLAPDQPFSQAPAIIAKKISDLLVASKQEAASKQERHSPQHAEQQFDAALRAYQSGDLELAARLCDGLVGEDQRSDDEGSGGEAVDRPRHLAAVIANRRGRPEEALRLLKRVAGRSAADPAAAATLVAAIKLLAQRALSEDRPDNAERAYRMGVVLAPNDRALLVNLAVARIKRGRSNEALQPLGWALSLNADDAEAWSNCGLALERHNRERDAEAAYRRAIAINPKYATARDNMGLLLLKRGALREGYAERDWRFGTPHFSDFVKPSSAALWRGENLTGKTLFVWREQGVGDEVMFASCYWDLPQRAGKVVVQCDKRLLGLFSRSFPQIAFIPEGEPPPPHDAHVPAGTLLRRQRGQLSAFPCREGYLKVAPSQQAFWRARLTELGPGLKIGLAWRSKLINSERKDAYIDPCDWEPVLKIRGAHFINLQYGNVAADLKTVFDKLGVRIIHFNDLNLTNDIDGAAALMSTLDLVMSPAMSVAELAAAVGAPTWRLAAGDWTGLGTNVRPPYPTMRSWSPRLGGPLRLAPKAMAIALRQLIETGGVTAPPAPPAPPLLQTARQAFADGEIKEAATQFAAILSHDWRVSAAWVGLGACCAELGENRKAQNLMERALALDPADPAALSTWGNAAAANGRHGKAAVVQQRAVRLAPGFWPAWSNLGVVMLALGRDAEAERCGRRALNGLFQSAGVWSNYAAALRSLGRFKEAAAALGKAQALSPSDPGVLAGLTRLLRLTDSAPLANPWMSRAVRLAPSFPAIAFNYSLEMLRAGRLGDGWSGYERRYDAPELAYAPPRLPGAPWLGENLRGKRLLVWGEQGVGDQLLFAGILPDLLARAAEEGGRVALAFDPRLAGLLANSFPDAEVIVDVGAPGSVDYHCGVGSLSGFFRQKITNFPCPRHGYLRPDSALADEWRKRFAALPAGLRVGVAWRSGLLSGERKLEYFELTDLEEMLRSPRIVAVNLLYGAEKEIESAVSGGMRIFDWPFLDMKNDFSSVAAMISNLDLVIAPAVSVSELSAALGVPTWRLSMDGDWTRLGTQVRPWHPAQNVLVPRRGETIGNLSRRVARLLARNMRQN